MAIFNSYVCLPEGNWFVEPLINYGCIPYSPVIPSIRGS